MWSVIGSTYLCNTRSEDDGKSSECKIHLAAALPADHAEIYFARGPVKWCTGIRADGRSQKRGLARAITLAVQLTSRLSAGVRAETESSITRN